MANKEYLEGILNLILDFNSRQLNYCHWKSNIHLERSLKGLTDLDLLVDAAQVELFKEILIHHDVKAIVPTSVSQYPTIEHYLGMDKNTGNLFHLHVHYQLILGEQYIKNYHLPFEKFMLEETGYSHGNIAVPQPHRELLILVIRTLLKYRDRDVIKDLFSIRSPGIPEEFREEIKHLLARTTIERLLKTVKEEMNIVSPDLIIEYLNIILKSPRKGWRLYKLRSQLRQELSNFQLRSRWKASTTYYQILIRKNYPALFKYSIKKQPANGGKGIAFIGADGAGKSTLIQAVQKWLSWKLDVTRYYMGSQEPSYPTRIARSAAQNINRTYRFLCKILSDEVWLSKLFIGIHTFARNVYYLSIANDRYQRYLEGKRKASAGTIVLFDRYPLQDIHVMMPYQPMDGPRINNRGGKPGRLSILISKNEISLYCKIKPPDYLFILNVSPEVSNIRKPDHDIHRVQNKSTVIKEFNRDNLHFTEINADEDMDEVLYKTKLKLWEIL